jgi:putative ABC transport system permease protein
MGTLRLDMRYAVRTLVRAPGFTLVALVVLALGIGANSAIFTVFHSVLMKPLDYPGSERMALLSRQFPDGLSESLSAMKYLYLRDHMTTMDAVGAQDVLGVGLNLTGVGEPERLSAIRVTPGWFDVMGVRPALGRAFSEEEARPNGPRLVVLSHGLWQRRFGGDPEVLGLRLMLGGEPHEVAGVMPRGFRSAPEADVLSPLRLSVDPSDRANTYFVLGRMKPGATLDQAREESRAVYRRFRADHPQLRDGDQEDFTAISYHQFRTGQVRNALVVLLVAVGLVLLIACANVANLLLGRATGRQKEIAIRAALGADRAAVVRQLLAESLLLSLAGGALGLLLANWSLRALVVLSEGSLPRVNEIQLEWPALLFTLGVAVLTGVIFGLAPALQVSRTDLNSTLREGSGRAAGSLERRRFRQWLVTAEVALAVVLLCGAGVLVRTFMHLQSVDPGFEASRVLTFQMALGTRYGTIDRASEFLRQAQERIELIPGVVSAGLVTNLPTEMGPDLPFEILNDDSGMHSAQWRNVSPRYFETMGVRLVAGRTFRDTDSLTSEKVVVINESLARRHFAGRSPLGQRIVIGRAMGPVLEDAPRVVVGVVGNICEQGVDRDPPPTCFLPTAQIPQPVFEQLRAVLPLAWVVRTTGSPGEAAEAVRAAVRSVDQDQPLSNIRTMETVLTASLGQRRFHTVLLGLFAGLALVLAAVGLYGLLGYMVTQRTQEIGVRVALGATAGSVVRLVVTESLKPVLAGIVIGMGVAMGAMELLDSLVTGVSTRDPLSFAAVTALLLAVTLAAALAPVWRALRIDPLIALRYE